MEAEILKEVEFWNYKINENGQITSPYGKILKNRRIIYVYKDGDFNNLIPVSCARFIYSAFNNKEKDLYDTEVVISHKNGNNEDYNISNLFKQKKGNNLHGENHSGAKLTNEQVEEIRQLYFHKKEEIGSNNTNTRISFRKLGEMFNVSKTTIRNIVIGTSRNEQKYIWK